MESQRIFISNRLPFSVDATTGELKRGSGGLVSALMGVTLDESFYWFGFETDAEQAKGIQEKMPARFPHLRCQPVVLDKKLYEAYYDGFANDVLWPLFHYEGNFTLFRRENWEAYQEANRLMAEKILTVCGDEDEVWIHDFHFLLLPQYLREKKPRLKIGFFLHIPFPATEIYRQLPVREEILRALTQCDLIGFHEHSYLRHFVVALQTLLGVETHFFRAQIGEHVLNMGVYPISVDNQELHQRSKHEAVKAKAKEYELHKKKNFLVLGVDRLDYTKGVELKLRGFQRALQKYPDLHGKMQLLQIAVPTRKNVLTYQNLRTEVEQLVGGINGEFGRMDYNPVNYIYNSVSETELLAIYQTADACLITSKRDGMNLVAMEYALCQDLKNPGTLILSEFAGAASLLSEALMINPWDEDSIADALHRAFTMAETERRQRIQKLQSVLSRYSAT
jgi:trehalose 6-phosphate synthase/phosphatase